MKKLIVINQYVTQLFIDIIHEFVDNGYEVTLLAGSITHVYKPLSGKVSLVNLVAYNRTNMALRIITWFVFTVQVLFYLLVRRKHPILLASNPPLIPLLLSLFPGYRKGGIHVIFYDIYPDVLIQLNKLVKEGWVSIGWSKFNHRILKRADSIITISELMKNQLKSYYGAADIQVIPCWADTSTIFPIKSDDNSLRKKLNLQNKFVVLFSGNFGASHQLETIIHVAKKLEDESSIHFVLIGEGSKKAFLEKMSVEMCLKNVAFLPWQSAENLHTTFTLGDIGLVTLAEGIESLSVPSKTYFYLASGLPIIGISSGVSEVDDIVSKYECGAVFNPEDINGIAEYLIKLNVDSNMINQLKMNAREASKSYDISNANKIFNLIVKNIDY